MLMNLDKIDLISLVKGTSPGYSVMDHPLIKDRGSYSGSYGTWSWYGLVGCSEAELLAIYVLCKKGLKG